MTTPLVDSHGDRYGNAFLLSDAPDHRLPQHGMPAVDAMRLLGEELVLDGIPMRNLATFVTTWMEPEAQRVIAENLHRNYIDHAEYPQTAEIEQRCIRMLADLFHAPGETTGTRTQGSSEAIMLGALSLKWKWRERREAAGQGDRPAEPRVRRRRARRVGEVLPLLRRRAADHPAAARQVHDRARGRRAARRREHDRRRRGARARRSPATPTTSSASTRCWCACATSAASTSRCTSTAPAAASCGRSCTRTRRGTSGSSSVRSINVSGHKYGLVYPGLGWLIFREPSRPARGPRVLRELPRQARRDVHAELLHRRGMVLAQYYNFVRYGHDGYRYIMETMQANARALAERDRRASASSSWSATRAPSSSRSSRSSSPRTRGYDEFDIASQLAAERGWMVPAYTLPPNAEHVTIMRALVKQTLGHSLATTLADDIAEACATLDDEGRAARARPPAREDRHRLLRRRAMCRWMAWSGQPVMIEELLFKTEARARRPEPALAPGRRDHQRRRLRHRLVRGRRGRRHATAASPRRGTTPTCARWPATSSRRSSSPTSAPRPARPCRRPTATRSATGGGSSCTTA